MGMWEFYTILDDNPADATNVDGVCAPQRQRMTTRRANQSATEPVPPPELGRGHAVLWIAPPCFAAWLSCDVVIQSSSWGC